MALLAALVLTAASPGEGQGRALPDRTPRPPHEHGTYFWRSIDTDRGLPETVVNAIVQTPDGYYWLGTRRGVVRYDGSRFQLFPPETERALGSGIINGLSLDRSGRLWIATNLGVTVRESGRFRRVAPEVIPNEITWRVLQDRKGRYWVAGQFGVLVGDGASFTPVRGADSYTYALHEDARGRIWMVGRQFLASIGDGEDSVTVAPFAKEERFFDVVGDGRGGIWVGTRAGAWHIDISDPKRPVVMEQVATGSPELGNEVWALARTSSGDLWLGTESHGVLKWDGTELDSLGPRTGGNDQVWSMYADARGQVWAGTSSGMLQLQRSPFATLAEGLEPRSTWSVRAGVDGRIWTSTSDGQVAWLDGTLWRTILPRAGRREATSLWPLPDGSMLAAYAASRVLRVDAQRGVRETGIRIPDTRVAGAYADIDGSFYFMTDTGLFRHKDGKTRSVNAEFGLGPSDKPNVVVRDRRGRLLIGKPGLTIVDKGTITHYRDKEGLTDPVVNTVVPDERGNLWIGTADSGLYALRNGRVTHFGEADVRLAREVGGIAIDDLGFMWLTSSFGLLRVPLAELEALADSGAAKVELHVKRFDRADGLPTTEFNTDYQSVVHKDRAGMLWLPSYAGVVRVNPREVTQDTIPPQVHMERVLVDGVELPLAPEVHLTGHAARVEVTFAVTDALIPSRARVEYRMLGVDDTWREAEGRRMLSFGPLGGGAYRLEVRAASEVGSWNPIVASLALDVPLAPHERGWFIPALLLLSAGGVAAGARWRQRRLVARGRELAALVDERTRDLEASRATLELRVHERTAALQHELEERKRLEQRLLTAQKLESVGRLAGGVAHEINNSMSAVLGFAELAQSRAKGQPGLEDDLRDVVKAGRRVADITRQLLAFARRQQTARRPLQLPELVTGLERTMLHALGSDARLVVSCEREVPVVLADSSQVEQLLINLVKNARDAMPDGGTVRVCVSGERLAAPRLVGDTELAAGDFVTLEVADTGTGMTPEVRARLFEPFFTTKELHRGTGLGLAVVHGIVAAHQGAIDVHSAPGEGTRFVVWFPAHEGVVEESRDPEELAEGSETILLVEDEPTVRFMASRALELQGYRVHTASNGREAQEVARTLGDRYDLLLTDVMLPHVTGPELVAVLRRERPTLPVVYMSGYTGDDASRLEQLAATGTLVAKPFTRETIARAVREALDQRHVGAL